MKLIVNPHSRDGKNFQCEAPGIDVIITESLEDLDRSVESLDDDIVGVG